MITKHRRARKHGVCWFKHTAKDHLQKMWELAGLLEGCGCVIRTIKIKQPGQIIYEDEFQVVAVPVRDNRRRLI